MHGCEPVTEHGSPFGRLLVKLAHDICYFILESFDAVVSDKTVPGFDDLRKVIQWF